MEIGLNTLLVALMFVTILSMGIGNILVSMADIFNHATPSRRDKVHVGWIVLALIIHFNLFWHTREILNLDDWRFPGFLMAMTGPVLMFFATSILLTNPPEDPKPDLNSFFISLGRRFFLMMALLQGWIVLVGYNMSGGFVTTDLVNIALAVLALVLASTKDDRAQSAGIFIAWGLVLISGGIRWLG